MAELDGEIVYQSGRTEVGESFCEDTALVRAYDKAVKPLQSVPAMERKGCHPHVNVPGESEGENETKREEEEEKGTKVQWQAGLRCCAVWSEDGLVYPAVVLKLLPDRGRCVVRFEGYGNEEEQDLRALLPAQDSEPSSPSHTQDSEPSDPTHTQDSEPSDPTHTTELHEEDGEDESRPESLKPVKKEKAKKQGRSCPERNHAFLFPFPFPPSVPPGYSGGPTFLPLPPPPPPPAFTFHASNCEGASDEIDVDSLSSMLLSWYLCGYHTGFHLGLQQVRAEAEKNCAKIKQAQLNTNKKLRKNLS